MKVLEYVSLGLEDFYWVMEGYGLEVFATLLRIPAALLCIPLITYSSTPVHLQGGPLSHGAKAT